ncbi:MAG: BatA and WFA domain-containing protein [Planctomycetota bacterium]
MMGVLAVDNPTIAALGLIAPWMLLGALLVSLPVIAHLLNRKASRRLVFPDLALLRACSASQSSLFKLRRWIVLILRALAVLLIVLAFAQPLWSDQPGAAAQGDRGSAVVMLVDRSLSVGTQGGGVLGVEATRAQADQVLAEMVSGVELANVVYADANPSAALPSMTTNLNVLRQELDRLEVTPQRADLASALGLAGSLLHEQTGGAGGQLVVVSDLQQTNWQDLDLQAASGKLPDGVTVTVVPPATPQAENTSLSDLRVEPATPVTHQPVTLRAKLNNFADSQRVVNLTLRIDGRQVESRSITLEPWQQRELALSHRFESVGDHRVEVSINEDALDGDNAAYLAVRVYERVPVVIIGDNHPNESGTDTYFLSRAVAPRGGQNDAHEVRYVTSQEPVAGQFDGAAAVLIGGSKQLDGSLLTALRQHLEAGGGVVLFCDDGPIRDNLAALVNEADGGVMPWEPISLRDLGTQGNWITLEEGDWTSAVLDAFDPASQESLRQIAFRRVWQVDSPHDYTRVLLNFEDGSPAVGQIPVGLGTLVVCNFSPALNASDLGKYGSFVALTHALVDELMPQFGGSSPVFAGLPLTFGNIAGYDPAGPTPVVIGPDGAVIADAGIQTLGDLPVATVRRAEQVGFYEVNQGGRTLALAAVNTDPRESDPRRMDEGELTRRFAEAGTIARQVDAQATGGLLELRGTPLWGWMAMAAMALLAMEMMVVGYFKR